MPSSKREREYERRRYEKWHERQLAQVARRRHRQRVIIGSVLGIVLVGVAVAAVVVGTRGDDTPAVASGAPDPSVAEGRTWTGTITFDTGAVGLDLDGAAAPQAVANFVTLANEGYFDSTTCHRLAPSINVLQCGDPTATGTGGPGYTWGPIENAPADDVYPAGTIAMARTSNDGSSMGSQFFLVYADAKIPSDNAGGYTVFGHITSGLDVVKAIADAGVTGGATDGSPSSVVTIEGVETQ